MHEEEENMLTLESPSEVYYRAYRDYWHKVNESDGFDLENISTPPYYMFKGLLPFDCVSCGYPYPVMVNLYAKVGLHRYNMLKGTNFQLDSLVKFNMLPNCVSSFYITLLAHDPALDPLDKTFQVRVDEQNANCLDFTCSIARLKDEGDLFCTIWQMVSSKGELPDWPSDDALKDEKRFYLLKESEWQTNDWISMYLELVICAHDRRIQKAKGRSVPIGDSGSGNRNWYRRNGAAKRETRGQKCKCLHKV
ncbi:hypothetical protein HID58_025796 [Brassica napus]|uniref:Uncharacterized protein n=1 Tax=Brassica napus TaxID=3708 RepID=A0ABQ8CM83_BRANA|nr:hypothetical protein HID58_025796 [Brassica napus]